MIDCKLFLLWYPGAGGNFLQSLFTWGDIKNVPCDIHNNLYDSTPLPSVAQIDNMNDIHIVESSDLISCHSPNDFYLDNYEFKCKEAWAITISDLETLQYVTDIKDIKSYGGKSKKKVKQRHLDNYNEVVEKVSKKIDNLLLFDYNDIFVKRNIFKGWNKSIKQYHEKNLRL